MERGSQVKAYGWVLEAGEDKEVDLSLELLEGNTVMPTL